MGNLIHKAEQTEAQKLFETIASYLTNAEKLLQQLEELRKKTLSPETRESFEKDMARRQQEWAAELRGSIRRTTDHQYELGLQKSEEMLNYMDDLIRSYPEADTEELQQKRAAFADRLPELTAVSKIPALDKRAMEAYDSNVKRFDQTTIEDSRKLQKYIAEVKQELEVLKKDQEEILKKQEALRKADFHGDLEKEMKLLEVQQKSLTDRGLKLRNAVEIDVNKSSGLFAQAEHDLRSANKRSCLELFLDPDRDEKIRFKAIAK